MKSLDSKPNRWNRHLRISLRTSLLILTILCVSMGWWLNRWQTQKTAAAALQLDRADVSYQTILPEFISQRLPKAEAWLEATFGIDAVATVTQAVVEKQHHLSHVARFPNLELLHIDKDVDSLQPIAGLRNLAVIFIEPSLTDLRPLKRMRKLRSIYAETCELETGVEFLRGLRKLVRIDLFNTKFDSLEVLSDHTQLKSLSLNGERLTSLEPLKKLTRLKTLRISHLNVNDLSPLSALKELEEINLSQGSISDLSPLSGLTKLTEVDLQSTKIDDLSPLANLSKLKDLHIFNTAVACLEPLKNCSQLQYLNVDQTAVSDLSVIEGLTKVARISIGGSKLTSELVIGNNSFKHLEISNSPQLKKVVGIENLSSLSSLSIIDTGITNLEELTHLNSLSEVRIVNSPVRNFQWLEGKNLDRLTIQGSPLEELPALVDIKTRNVILHDTQLKDLKSICQIRQIESLHLNGNSFVSLEGIGELESLKSLTAGGTNLDPACKLVSQQIESLSLSDCPVCDTKFFDTPNLNALYVENCPLENLVGIADAPLTMLYLDETQVTNVKPVVGLAENTLRHLIVINSPVKNLSPLAEIRRGKSCLTDINFTNTNVSDISAIAHLKGVHHVSLDGTRVSDLSPLRGYSELITLSLPDTPVADITALKGLSDLDSLDLSGTQVTDFSILNSINELQVLDLSRTKFSNLQDLIGLDELAILDLSDCPVSNFQPLKDLPELYQLTAKDLGDKELQQLNEMLPKLVVIR